MTHNLNHQTNALTRVSRQASLPYIAKLLLAATLLSYAPATRAASSSYNYQVFAKPGDVIGDVTLDSVGTAFLSDDGSVVFIGRYNSCCEALFFKRSAAARGSILVRQGDLIDGRSISLFREVKRNDRGEIVFSANIDNGSSVGIFRLKSAVALPGETLGGITLTNVFGDFDLNDPREIVFDAFSGSPADNAVYGIFTPNRVLVRSGDVIGGLTLQVPAEPTLSKNGVVAFTSTFEDSEGQLGIGVFTQHRLVVKGGDSLDGLPLLSLGEAIISENGVIGIAFDYSLDPIRQAFAVGGKIAVKSGDVIDGFTIVGQPDGIPFPATLNASGGSPVYNRRDQSRRSWQIRLVYAAPPGGRARRHDRGTYGSRWCKSGFDERRWSDRLPHLPGLRGQSSRVDRCHAQWLSSVSTHCSPCAAREPKAIGNGF